MITDSEKHAAALQFAEMLEAIDDHTEVAEAVVNLSLEDFTTEMWSDLQACQEGTVALLQTLKQMLIESSKLFNHDALLAHIEAVVTAQD